MRFCKGNFAQFLPNFVIFAIGVVHHVFVAIVQHQEVQWYKLLALERADSRCAHSEEAVEALEGDNC